MKSSGLSCKGSKPTETKNYLAYRKTHAHLKLASKELYVFLKLILKLKLNNFKIKFKFNLKTNTCI